MSFAQHLVFRRIHRVIMPYIEEIASKEDPPLPPGVTIDDQSNIRVFIPELYAISEKLVQETSEYLLDSRKFQDLTSNLINRVSALAEEVEMARSRAIGSRSRLHEIMRERTRAESVMKATLQEKELELERLRIQFSSLLLREQQQKDWLTTTGAT
eukprot:Colp12_sorted_trinity150504_noHs@20198